MSPLSTAMLIAAAPVALQHEGDLAEFHRSTDLILSSCRMAPQLRGALPARMLRAHAPRAGASAAFISLLDAIERQMRINPVALRPSTWTGYWPSGPHEAVTY